MTINDIYNLELYKPLFRKSNGKTVTKGGTGTIIAGNDPVAPLDFYGFPNLLKMDNGNLILTFSLATGHGAEPVEGSGSYIMKSTNNGQSWSSPVERNRPAGLESTGYAVGLNNRIICWAHDATAYSGARVPYCYYTDDEWATLSEPYKVSNSFDGDGRQADATGTGIRVGNTIYKSLYGRTASSGNRYGQLFKSTDNGETMQFLCNIGQGATIDYEEVQLIQSPKGYLIASLRSDSAGRTDFAFGFSETVWTWPYNVNLPNYGKPAMGISPSGTILMIGRHYDSDRVIWIWSNDDFQTVHWDYLSERTNYQTYSSIQWIGDRFLAVWAEDENFPNGPCKIYQEYFYET